jgi:hypothetical protein
MKFIQDTQSFEVLKQYFTPAKYRRRTEGKSKFYELSISIDGMEKIIKKYSKSFLYTGFDKVIMGAVLRMEKLFAPEDLNLEVILFKKPELDNIETEIAFELINKNNFMIGQDAYIASIMVEYSYSKMKTVTYYPIIYRQVCSNGMVSVFSKNFKEKIPVNKIFEIGCDWSRCTFETYQRKLNNYFEILKDERKTLIDRKNDNFEQNIIKKMERVLKTSILKNREDMEVGNISPAQNARNILSENIERLGSNEFAIWNAITDFASRQIDVTIRNQMFLNAGRYLSNEIEKTLNKNKKAWAENLNWNEVLLIAKK